MSREVVLGRVRDACGQAPGSLPGSRLAGRPDVQPADHLAAQPADQVPALPGDRPALPGDLPALPAPLTVDDPVGLFVERAAQVGVGVEPVASMEEAAARAAAWCRKRGARSVAVWETDELAPVVTGLATAGVEILGPHAPVDALVEAEAGITGADWGIAETGTLVLASAPGQPRLASLLPPAHLAVLRADRIVPDLATLFDRGGPLPSALTCITGPSRSADIGLVPTLGAHGPMEVLVFLLDG